MELVLGADDAMELVLGADDAMEDDSLLFTALPHPPLYLPHPHLANLQIKNNTLSRG